MKNALAFKWQKITFMVLSVIGATTHLYFNLFGTVSTQYQNVFHFSLFIVLGSMIYPFISSFHSKRIPAVIETGIAIAAAGTAVYLAYMETAVYVRGGHFTIVETVLGIFLLVVIIEYARRVSGNVIPVIILFSLSYITWLGPYLSGVFNFAGLSFKNVLFRSIYGDDGVFGNLASISSTYVFLFILFGGFLQVSRAGDFIIEVSRGLMSRFTGGQGFIAIMASALTGTISGSAVANTASTGVITIPLMKKAGYRAEFAGGIEAAASTGGQLMPPIMGAGIFVMASYTGIPYSKIVMLSTAPAILYFASVFFLVYLEAKKQGISTVADDQFHFWELMKRSGFVFIVPIAILVTMLILGFSPAYTAGFSILAIVGISWFTPNKMTLPKIVEAVEVGCRNMIMTALILISIGLVVNSIVTAGVGNTFSLMISDWSGGNLLFTIFLIALASLVLGMGLPVTASYIVLATLTAPALAGIIQQSYLIESIVSNGLSDAAKIVLSLGDASIVEKLSLTGLTAGDTVHLLGQLPDELLSVLRQTVLPADTILLILLSAHLIVFWLSQDSNITPPVCLVAFTAASIAKSSPMKTGFEAWKLAKGLYIVPVLFAYTSLISGSLTEILAEFTFALFGIFALSVAMQGFMHHKLGILSRLMATVVSLAILQPYYLWLDIVGVIILLAGFIIEKKYPFSV